MEILFTSGETGLYDCRPLLNFGVFKELTEGPYLRQVRAFRRGGV